MPEKTKLICITCPKGCTLEVTREGNTILDVDAGCKRGMHYAEEELNDPRRMVATTVRILGSTYPLLPVATGAPFPKPMIQDLLKQLRQIEVSAPVKMGDVVLTDALGTGIDIIASRNM
jgi:CxxC motif-containing protein